MEGSPIRWGKEPVAATQPISIRGLSLSRSPRRLSSSSGRLVGRSLSWQFAAGGGGEVLSVVQAAAGQFSPVVAGVVGVSGVDE